MKRQLALRAIVVFMIMLIGGYSASAKDSHEVKFAVFSDPHLYHKSLGTEGTAFKAYLAQDRKLIRESEAILDAAIERIIQERKVKFVLVPGDITKDGERFNHFLFALKMKKLERAGIQVFVVPGNHDINNPHAFRYLTNGGYETIPNVSPTMFRWIYNDFGYRQAIRRDPNSLSYVVEPSPGVWLIAMDTCDYDRNEIEGYPATRGRFKTETLEWVLKTARQGKQLGKQLIGMMHHGILEHYIGQTEMFSEYVVDDWQDRSSQLAEAGLQIVFTGHFHANDVTMDTFGGAKTLYDIETGSLVTYPCPIRFVTLKPNRQLGVETVHITEVDYDTGELEFPEYAEDYLTEGLKAIATGMLIYQYGLPAGEPTDTYAGWLADAFKAHYAGNESPSTETNDRITFLQSQPDPANDLGNILYGLWNDLGPLDNRLVIELESGR